MHKRLLTAAAIILIWILFGCGAKDIIALKVAGTNPQNGDQNIDPSQTEIWVTFVEPMMDKSMFPQTTGDPSYTNDNTKCTLPVKIEPAKEYEIWINMSNIKDFNDKAGNPAEPYKFTPKTR